MLAKNTPVEVSEWKKMSGISGAGATWYRRLVRSAPVKMSDGSDMKPFKDWAICDGCNESPSRKFKNQNRGLYQYAKIPAGSPRSELEKEPAVGKTKLYCNASCLAKLDGDSLTKIRYHSTHANVGEHKKMVLAKAEERRASLRKRFQALGCLHGASTIMASEDGISRQAMSLVLRRAYDGIIPYKTAKNMAKGVVS